jgi:hypothetical protein
MRSKKPSANRLYKFLREVLETVPLPVRERFKRSLFKLQARGIRSCRMLLESIDSLPEAQLRIAIEVLGEVGKKTAVPKLLTILESKPSFRWESRNALTRIGGKRAFSGLKRILSDKKQSPDARFEACHGRAHQWQKVDPSIFFPIVLDKSNDARLRGQAVEGIAIHGRPYGRKQSDQSRRSIQLLLDCLHDSCAEVRFWGVFGTACLNIKKSLPKLRALARNDNEVACLGWSVAEEAKDAIHCLTKGRWPTPDASDRRAANVLTRSKKS